MTFGLLMFAAHTSVSVQVAVAAGVAAPEPARGALADCVALSPLLDDIHACLDDYLARMDERIAAVESIIGQTLASDRERAAFDASRRAFSVYRRENCLWYLSFSGPRIEAEQIAKDCLARMSLERLTELDRLISLESERDTVLSGYYVYDVASADVALDTFLPCGTDVRYRMNGGAIVDELRQRYFGVATRERQSLYVRLRGLVDTATALPDGYDGALDVNVVDESRAPREADCRLAPGAAEGVVVTSPVELPVRLPALEPDTDETPGQEEPVGEADERLIAYFGEWAADCTVFGATRECELSTALRGVRTSATDESVSPVLVVVRRPSERSRIELRFPDREIDSPVKIRWQVDGGVLGDIVDSSIRVDAQGTRQLVEESPYLRAELLPLLIAGNAFGVEVLGSVDDARGERFSATLIGLTRALGFADEFTRQEAGL